ncbi:hypothetical protein DFP73DRAFT_600072 [Morchella snyderi]|nr:hypothetical protein DFP73DRAFT_600072 [Morchella snyderi]
MSMDWSEGAQVVTNPASMISGPNDTPTTISSELATGVSKTGWSKSYSITRTSTRTRNPVSRNSGEAPHSESSSTFHIPSESCTLSVPTEALSTTGDQALHFPVLTTLTSIKFPPTYISGIRGIILPTERPLSEGLVGFSQTVSGLPTPQRTVGAALKLSQPIGLWASWNSGQKAAFLFGSIGLPVILILLGFVLWLRMSRPHRESDRVDHEENVGAGNNGSDYSDCGGDAHREIENKDQRHMEAAEEEEMASGLRRVSSFSSLSKRGLEKEIIRDSGFAYDHEIHGHISNAATRRISNNDQAKSIGRSSSHSPSDRRDSTSSSLSDDIQGSIDKRELRSLKQSFDTSIDKVEQVFSSGSCAGLAIEETSDNAYSLVAGPSSSDMSLRSEPANLVDEKQLDTSSVAQTTLMSPDFSMSSNSLRLIRSFISFETPQFPELGAETPTDISVQVLPDDNDNRAGTSNAGIHARDELANTSRSHGRGVPVSIVYSHSAHVKTVYAVAAEEGGDGRECWQRNTALEGPRHNYGDVE